MRQCCLLAWMVALLVVGAMGDAFPSRTVSLRNQPRHGPVLVNKGESLSKYPPTIESEDLGFIEGLRTLGEWMQSVGVFSDEEVHIPSLPDPSEANDLDIIVEQSIDQPIQIVRRDNYANEASNKPTAAPIVPSVCSRRGVLVNKTGIVDKCHGYKCYITSMACDGVFYSGNSLYTYIGSMDHCKVLSMNCPSKSNPVQIFTQACPIQKFLCPVNEVKLPSQLGGQSFEHCAVQTYCPADEGSKNVFYGWEAYDYECTNQELVCDGVVVSHPNGYRGENGTCIVRHVPCASVGSSSTNVCNRIESSCVTFPSQSACPNRVDHSYTCPASTPREYATIGEITCAGGVTHNYSSWSGSIASCTSIRSIRQGQDVFTLPYHPTANSYCILTELDCNGVRTPWNYTARIPDHCGVAAVMCGNASIPTTWPPQVSPCTTHEFGCKTGATVCTYVEVDIPCATRCKQPGITQQCDCPVDFIGSRCEETRTLVCDFNVTNARLQPRGGTLAPYHWEHDCHKDIPKRTLGEPVCHQLNNDDRLELDGRLNCSYPDVTLESLLATTITQFNYTLYADKFRLSNVSSPQYWTLYMKILDFNSFTDLSGSPYVLLTHAQMAGNDTITMSISPADLNERFKIGGRIRAEFQFISSHTAPHNMAKKVMKSDTFDVMDWAPNYPKAKGKVNLKILSLVLLSFFGAFVVGLFAWRYYKKKKQEASSVPS